jgi:hypothetical protein
MRFIRLKNNQNGFAIIEAAIIGVVIAAASITAGIVYHNRHNNPCPAGETPEYGTLAEPAHEKPFCLREGQQPLLTKPVIYLYPTHSEQVSVRLSVPAGLSRSVPNYNSTSGWQVIAQPDGTLTNLSDGKTYPNLFWESNPTSIHFNMTTGFVVTGTTTKAFLEHQLSTMGLNQQETNDFITYWIPRIDNNPYNLIHFAGSEYTDYAKLSIAPRPDSLLRVFMVVAPLQQPLTLPPQTFPVFHRVGFTVVEWGGTELY